MTQIKRMTSQIFAQSISGSDKVILIQGNQEKVYNLTEFIELVLGGGYDTSLLADTINEATADAGVTIEGVLLKDSSIFYPTTTSITAFATGGQASATALTTEVNNITVCATAGDSVKLPTAVAGLRVVVKNNGATAADIFPVTGGTINGLSANTAIRIPAGSVKIFYAVNGTNWQSISIIAAATGSVSLPAFSFDTSPDMGMYRISSTQLGFAVGATLKGGFNASGLFGDVISEQTATAGVTIDGALVKDGGISANGYVASFTPLGAPQALSGPGVINNTSYLTQFTSTGTGDALTLAASVQPGATKKITYIAEAAGGDTGVLTLPGYTSITLNAIGNYVTLICDGTNWFIMENVGCTVVA